MKFKFLKWGESLSRTQKATILLIWLGLAPLAGGVGPLNFYPHEIVAGMVGFLFLGYLVGASIHWKATATASASADN